MKGKKCIYLIGPPHHQRIVYPVLENLEKEGLKVIYLAVSQEPAYESFCIDRKIPFKYEYEYMDETIEKSINHALKTAGKEFASIIYGTEEGSEWSATIMSKIYRWMVEDLYIFRDGLIEKEKPDFIIFQNELNMWSKLLGYIGYSKGIPVVSFQEGMYYSKLFWFKYHNNYSVNLMLSKTSADVIIEAGSNPHRIIIVGNTYFDKMVKEFSKERIEGFKREKSIDLKKPVILVIISFADLKHSIIDLFQLMLKELENLPPAVIIFKYHPIMDLKHVIAFSKALSSKKHKLLHVHDEEVYPYLFASDICITTGRSTLVSEALALGKPVIDVSELIHIPDYYGNFGVVVKPKNISEIREKMADLLTESLNKDMERRIKEFGIKDIGSYEGAIGRASQAVYALLNIKENYSNMRGYMSAKVYAYKIGDSFVLSIFELEDKNIDAIYKSFKSKNADFGVPKLNGKYPFIKYEDNEKPFLTDKFEEAEAFSGIVVCKEEIIEEVGGWIDYKNPVFTLLDIANHLYLIKAKGCPLDLNIEVEEKPLTPLYIEDPEDVLTFYVNNIFTRGKMYGI